MLVPVSWWRQSKVCSGVTNFVNWNQVDLIKFSAVNSEIFTFPSIVTPIPFLACDVVVSRIELEYCIILINPGRLTLDAKKLSISILNHQIITLIPTIGSENYITGLQQTRCDCSLANLAFYVCIMPSFCDRPHLFLLLETN